MATKYTPQEGGFANQGSHLDGNNERNISGSFGLFSKLKLVSIRGTNEEKGVLSLASNWVEYCGYNWD